MLERHGRLDLLVNNAGAAWRATLRRRRLRERAPHDGHQLRRPGAAHRGAAAAAARLRAQRIVNVSSTAGRVARARSGAYSASKFALAGWSDALFAEEHAHGVHVGLVLPGFISTEGFPQSELTAKPWTRWIVSTPEKAAEAIYEAGIRRRAERYVPRAYGLAAALRILAPSARPPRADGRRRRRHDYDDPNESRQSQRTRW